MRWQGTTPLASGNTLPDGTPDPSEERGPSGDTGSNTEAANLAGNLDLARRALRADSDRMAALLDDYEACPMMKGVGGVEMGDMLLEQVDPALASSDLHRIAMARAFVEEILPVLEEVATHCDAQSGWN